MKINKFWLVVLNMILVFGIVQARSEVLQDKGSWKIEGVVASEDREPLPGVLVILKGTQISTVTNIDGQYNLTVPGVPGTLVFSMMGMGTKEISFKSQERIEVVLNESSLALDEVMVVGYGTQKKVNLTGAVDQVTSEAFENRPVTNLAQGLQGKIPNLNLVPGDGKPTQSPAFNVRGATSIGQGGSALVLIDGVEGDPALLNPRDIETVTVLKDAASASIYGARGAFGVVLITTKNPSKEKLSVTYSSNYAVKQPTTVPEFVTDSYQWASMFNEAFSSWNNYASTPQNVNKTLPFSQEYLMELKRRSEDPSLPKVEIDPNTGEYVYYENTNWLDHLYKSNTYSFDQNISISGSADKTRYLISGQYMNQPGLFKYNSDDYKMYNFRAKGSIDVASWLTIGNNTNFSNVKYFNPLNVGEAGGIWRNIVAEGHPMAPLHNPDGTLTHSAAYTVGDFWYGKNGLDKDRRVFRNTSDFDARFLSNKLSIKGNFTYQITDEQETRKRVPVPFSRTPGVIQYLGESTNDLREIYHKREYLASNLYGEYNHTFGLKHNFKVLSGFNYEMMTYNRIGAQRNGLIYEHADDLNLALGDLVLATGGYERWNVMGGFFRLNYDYDSRYLLEVNGRYDGSSKFPEDERFAFFPSVSAGWRVSSEPFWSVSDKIISDMKIRASHGSLGNGNINSYQFQEQLALRQSGRILGGNRPQITSNPNVIPFGLTWETATTQNVGLDMYFVNNKLSLVADAYIRKTTDMFTPGVQLPAVFGASSPRGNYADMETKGWEFALAWRDKVMVKSKPLNYSVQVFVSDHVSQILKYNNPDKRLNDYYEGQVLGEIWGLVTDGFFTSQEDIRSSADQSLFNTTASGVWRPGDIKFTDLNNDGVIDFGDNTVNSPGDRVIIGNDQPRFRFGANLSGDWNNFFFSAFIQGVGRQHWYPSRGANTFWGQYNAPYGHPPVSQIGNIWSEENPNAYFPRYTGYLAWTEGGTLRETQTRYLQNVAYMRLRNIQIGYNLPSHIASRIGAGSAQVYVSGENLFTFSPMYKITRDLDVENIGASDQDLANTNHGDGFNYPILKGYSVGLSITF